MAKYLIMVLLIAYTSCQKNSCADENVETLVIDNLSGTNELHLSQLCSAVNYVQLDSSKTIFFKGVPNIIVRDTLLFTLDLNNGCYGFNLNTGEQVLHINNIGNGPEEMAYPDSFYPDLKSGRIEIYDARKRKLFFFDMKGDFLKTLSCKGLLFKKFVKTAGGSYVLHTGNHINSVDGKAINSNVIFTDSAFNIKKSMIEITPERSRFQSSSDLALGQIDREIFSINFPDGRLYNVSGKKEIPVINIEFKEKNIPSALVKNKKGYQTAEWMSMMREKGYSAGISGFHENDRYKLLRFISFEEYISYYILYRKNDGFYEWFPEENIINDIDEGIAGKIVHIDNERIVMLIEPHILYGLNEEEKAAPGVQELLKRISYKGGDGNPVLLIGRLK